MLYYKILDLNNNFLGYVNSYALRYYYEPAKMMLNCVEDLGQYIYFNNSFYRVRWLHKESEEMKGKYPEVYMFSVPEEEYKNYIQSKKQNSEQK